MKQRKLDWITLVVSVLAGLVYSFFGEYFYQVFVERIPKPCLIGLYFFGLGVWITLIILICAVIRKDFLKHVTQYKDGKGILFFVASMLVGIFILGTVFEFIYELSGIKKEKVTSYIFAVDCSGSMSENDPDNRRYQAIEEIVSNCKKNFPFAIYLFSERVKLVREMLPVSEGLDKEKIFLKPGGGTAIYHTLDTIITDNKEGKWNGGKHPKLILLTDGEATDISEFDAKMGQLMDKYKEEKISISTVGLGNFNDQILKEIAVAAEGVCVKVEDASYLVEGMKTAIKEENNSDLLNIRQTEGKDYLHLCMRVVFLFLLGVVIRITIFVANCIEEDKKRIISISIVLSLLAGCLMEFVMQTQQIKPSSLRMLLCLLLTIMPSTKERIFSTINQNKLVNNLKESEKEEDIDSEHTQTFHRFH